MQKRRKMDCLCIHIRPLALPHLETLSKLSFFSHQGMVPPPPPPPQHCLVKTCISAIASLANPRSPFGMAYLINPSQCLLTRSVEGRHLFHAIRVGDTAGMPFLEADLVANHVVSLPCHCTLCPYLEIVRQVWPRACTSPLSPECPSLLTA